MAYDGSLIFNTKIDEKGFNTGTKSIQKSAGNLKAGFLKLGAAIGVAFGIKELIAFSSQAIETASDLQEVQNVVDTAFGSMTYKMEEFADKAVETYGISKLTAKQTGSNYMAMATGMNVALNTASDMSIALTGLSADMASFYNVNQDVASTALKSIFTGETETLKQFGVVMTEVNLQEYARQQGITKAINKMSQAEKVQLRYNYVMNATKLAQGDFAKTSSGWANQTRILSERWKEFKGSIGNALMVGLLPVINATNKAMSGLIAYAESASQALLKLFGLENQSSNKSANMVNASAVAAGNYNDIAEAAEETEKANDASVADFDEINKISDSKSEEASTLDATPINSPMQSNSDNPKSQDLSWVDKLKEKLEPVITALTKLWNKLQPLILFLKEKLGFIYNYILVPIANWTVTDALPRFLDAVATAIDILMTCLENGYDLFIDFYNDFLKPIAEYAGDKFTDFLDKLNKKLQEFSDLLANSEVWKDLKSILEKVYKVLKPVMKYLIDLGFWFIDFYVSKEFINLKYRFENLEDAIGLVAAVLNLDFTDAWEHFKDLVFDNKVDKLTEKFDLLKNKLIEFKDIVAEYIERMKSVIFDAFTNIGKKISDWWENDVKPWFTVEKWNELLQNIVDAFAEKWNAVYNFFYESVPKWWDDNIHPWFTKEKWSGLLDDAVTGLESGWNSVLDFFNEALPKWWEDNIKPWFTAEKWKEIGGGIKDGLVSAFADAFNAVVDILNWFIDKLNKISLEIPETKGITKGFHVGFGFDKIEHWTPALATGTVVPANYGNFLATLGDNKKEPEIVSPLSTIEQAVKNAMGSNQSGGDITIPIYIGTEKIDTIVVSAQQRLRLAGGGY